MTIAETWGRIYAVIERVRVDGALKAHEINLAAATPGNLFGGHYASIQRRLPPWADIRLQDLLDNISPEDMGVQLNLEQQGNFFLGLYHERSSLAKEGKQVMAGRPLKGSDKAVDWSGADWSQADAALGRELRVSRQAVAAARKRHGK